MVKGIDILTDRLAYDSCPSEFGLTDTKRVLSSDGLRCIYGEVGNQTTCQACFKEAVNLEYESEADNE